MIAIIDYGVGNLFSLKSSIAMIGAQAVVTGEAEVLRQADRIILPGVGAFADAAAKLRATGLDQILCEQARLGKPVLGICLGMQMLFERSLEYGNHPGLGLIPGVVRPIAGKVDPELKIPHIGWNALHLTRPDAPLLQNTKEGDCVYFVHSFYADECDDALIATAEYGIPLTAAVANGNIMGCQFHPEKSGTVGLNILRAFCGIKEDKS